MTLHDDDRTAGRVVLRALGDAQDALEVAHLAVQGFLAGVERHGDAEGVAGGLAASHRVGLAQLSTSSAATALEAGLAGHDTGVWP